MKNIQVLNFMKIRPVAAELFHVDAQTGMTKPMAVCRNFAKAHKIEFAADSLTVLGSNSEHHDDDDHHHHHHQRK